MTDQIKTRSYADTDAIKAYAALAEEYPVHFSNEGRGLQLVLDERELIDYFADTGNAVGLMTRSKYWTILRDVVKGSDGSMFPYVRMLPGDMRTSPVGVVTLMEVDGKFLLSDNYRHATGERHLEIVRGFANTDLLEAAKGEVAEEVGMRVVDARELGETHVDTGLTSAKVAMYFVKLENVEGMEPKPDIGEVIHGTIRLEPQELLQSIAEDKITDQFTLAACAKIFSHDRQAFSTETPITGGVDLTGRSTSKGHDLMSISTRNPFSSSMPSQQRGRSIPTSRI